MPAPMEAPPAPEVGKEGGAGAPAASVGERMPTLLLQELALSSLLTSSRGTTNAGAPLTLLLLLELALLPAVVAFCR